MSHARVEAPFIEAYFVDVDRETSYLAHLQHVPRVGELVKLFSHLDSATGHRMHSPTGFNFEVIQVRYNLSDYVENIERSHDYPSSVAIYVRQSHDPMVARI